MINKSPEKIREVLTRRVQEVISRPQLEKKLRSGRKIRIKFGIDPTSSILHLGHSIPLKKLREFQELGHQIIFLIGDFTARIGDPSGRATQRKILTEEEVKKNMKDYIDQAAKILDVKKVEIRYNSEWYEKMRISFFMDLASRFTYAQLIERDEFRKRIEKDIDISLQELIYPLLQGYDSVVLRADLEIGGTDQKFNLLMGRKVQKRYNLPQQDIMTLPLLIGTDGVNKMSKSLGNYIGIKENPSDMYGKIMSIPDAIIWHYFELLTDLPIKEIENMKREMGKGVLYPREAKAKLAREIVTIYHGKRLAQEAEREFQKVFKEKKLPTKIPELKIQQKRLNVLDLLVWTKLVVSRSQAKRLISQRGVKIDGKVISDWKTTIQPKKGMIIQVGKRNFLKLV
jgi:tyrosyl-tRNA synthetase